MERERTGKAQKRENEGSEVSSEKVCLFISYLFDLLIGLIQDQLGSSQDILTEFRVPGLPHQNNGFQWARISDLQGWETWEGQGVCSDGVMETSGQICQGLHRTFLQCLPLQFQLRGCSPSIEFWVRTRDGTPENLESHVLLLKANPHL